MGIIDLSINIHTYTVFQNLPMTCLVYCIHDHNINHGRQIQNGLTGQIIINHLNYFKISWYLFYYISVRNISRSLRSQVPLSGINLYSDCLFGIGTTTYSLNQILRKYYFVFIWFNRYL